MRGSNEEQDRMFSYRSAADCVPMDHPLRAVKDRASRALKELSADFDRMYAAGGRPSIPPENLIRALLCLPEARCPPGRGWRRCAGNT